MFNVKATHSKLIHISRTLVGSGRARYYKHVIRKRGDSHQLNGFIQLKERERKTSVHKTLDYKWMEVEGITTTDWKIIDREAIINEDDRGNVEMYSTGTYMSKGDTIATVYEDKILPGRMKQKDNHEQIIGEIVDICKKHHIKNDYDEAKVETYEMHPRFVKEFDTAWSVTKSYDAVARKADNQTTSKTWFARHPPNTWQAIIKNILGDCPDDRKIYIFRDYEEGTGKTQFTKHYCMAYPAQTESIKTGKSRDIAEVIYKKHKTINTVFIDVPREDIDIFNYGQFERIKDGRIHREKWESTTVHITNPHMFLFTNADIKYKGMSSDRWQIYNITKPEGMGAEYCSTTGPLNIKKLIEQQESLQKEFGKHKWTNLNPKEIKTKRQQLNLQQSAYEATRENVQESVSGTLNRDQIDEAVLIGANIGRLQALIQMKKGDNHKYIAQIKTEESRLHNLNIQCPPMYRARDLTKSTFTETRQNDISLNKFIQRSPKRKASPIRVPPRNQDTRWCIHLTMPYKYSGKTTRILMNGMKRR